MEYSEAVVRGVILEKLLGFESRSYGSMLHVEYYKSCCSSI